MILKDSVNVWSVLSPFDWIIFSFILLLTIGAVFYGLSLRNKLLSRFFFEKKGRGAKGVSSNTEKYLEGQKHFETNLPHRALSEDKRKGFAKAHPIESSPREGWIEYLLMGRQLTLPLFVATLVASWYGNIFAVTQIAYEHGLYSFLSQGVFWYITYGMFAYFLARRIRKYKVLTLPHLLEKIIGPGPAKFAAVLVFFKTLPLVYTISLGIFIEFLFGIPFMQATLIGLSFVVFYSLFGGFRAVVFSDFVQFCIMYIGIISVVVFSFLEFGGIDYLISHIPASYFSFTGDFSISTSIVWFFIALSTTFLNPTFYQRCFAAKSDKVAVRGIWIATAFWIGFDLCQLAIGLYAKAALPHANPMNACMNYAIQILPVGWKGVFLAAVLATLLSTLDSFLLISSAVLSYDLKIFKKLKPFKAHLYTLIITGMLTLAIAMTYEGHIETVWRTIKGFFAACLLVPVLWSYIKPSSIRSSQFAVTSVMVISSMLLWEYYGFKELDSFYVGNLICIVSLLLFKAGEKINKN